MSSDPSQRPLNPKEKLASQVGRDDIPEENLWSGTYSGKAMIGTWILLGAISIVVLILLFTVSALRDTPTARNVVLLLLVLAWLIPLLLLGYRKLAYFYELTNQRLKHRDGILVRRNNRIEVIDIDDVSFQQGIIETLFKVGTIRVQSSDSSHPQLVLKGIADVKQVADLIDAARRAERQRRGLYVEAV
jgi:uncharacterized membrane protein YdbT with pleckstrin-like domain